MKYSFENRLKNSANVNVYIVLLILFICLSSSNSQNIRFTVSGRQCVFPSKHDGVEYNNCIVNEKGQEWCYYDKFGISWDFCARGDFRIDSSVLIKNLDNSSKTEFCLFRNKSDKKLYSVECDFLLQVKKHKLEKSFNLETSDFEFFWINRSQIKTKGDEVCLTPVETPVISNNKISYFGFVDANRCIINDDLTINTRQKWMIDGNGRILNEYYKKCLVRVEEKKNFDELFKIKEKIKNLKHIESTKIVMQRSKSIFLLAILAMLFVARMSCDELTSTTPEIKELRTEKEIVDGFSSEDRDLLERSSEKFNFNADVTRLMDIIINSLYTHKEVFIRELISNASDACDKARFLAVQNPDFLGDKKDLEIRVETDPEAKTFTIIDTGIGMTKNDLVKNLGTIAKSGTTSFIEAISKGNSLNLIGQFGVGFYSTYLVSNKVVVTSKHHDDEQHVWVSTAGSYFTVSKDPRGDTLKRGSRVTLYLKEDALDFAEENIVRKNIKKYSEFINYPIYVRVNKTYTREEEIPEEPTPERADNTTESTNTTEKKEDLEVTEETKEEKTEEKKKKTRTVTDWKFEWELVNENKPIWLRNSKEIQKEEYYKFYKSLSKDTEDPHSYEHGQVEGEVNFKYLIYVPSKKPYDLFENYYGKNAALKLYVRRVLVNEQFEELMPRYMNFIKGVVDSDDLPLNVSREQLQQHKMIKVMSRSLVRKAIQMLNKMSTQKVNQDDDDEEEDEEEEKENDKTEENKQDDKKKTVSVYNQFWENFGKNIKLGIIEDVPNRSRLAKLLRFYSTKNPKDLISLDDYIKNMKPKQEFIYYIAGEEKEVLFKSPLIQKLKERDVDVLLLDDPIDEFCIQNLSEYEKKKLKNVAKGDPKLWDEDDEDSSKQKDKKIKEEFASLVTWWKKVLGESVEKIEISKRLVDTPCIVVSSEHGYSASMERIQKAQAFANHDKASAKYLFGRRTLEINPSHPSIKALREKVISSETPSTDVEDTATLLYEAALLESGYALNDPHEFAQRIDRVLKYNLDLDRYAKASPYEVNVGETKKEETTSTTESTESASNSQDNKQEEL